MKKFSKDLVIILFLIVTILFLWFHKGLLFAGGEEGIPFYDLNKTLKFISFSWQDISAGFPIQLNLNRIPYFTFLNYLFNLEIPGYLVQTVHFFIIMSFGTISLYFLLRETLNELKDRNPLIFERAPLIGAIFYLLNPFSMNQIWGRGVYIQFFPFALFPFSLLMFALGLRYKNFIFVIVSFLISIFFAGSFGNPSYIISYWLLLFVYLICYILKNKTIKEITFSIFYFLLMMVGWTLVHMWWINPFIKLSSNQFSSALNNLNENIGTLKGVSNDYPLTNILRLIHAGYVYRDQQYGHIYLSLPFILLSWIIPLTALFSVTIFKKLKIFLFFSTLFFLSVFICIGYNFPTGKLFILIFKTFPPLQSFRNPFEKFGIILTIAYAPFFAIGTIVVSKWVNKKIKKITAWFVTLGILFLVCGVLVWPMWTGQFAGGVIISPWVMIPKYYKELDGWLNNQSDDGRIIHLPINPGDGLRYSGWAYPYQGIEPGEYIFTRPSIGKNGQSFKSFYNVLLQRFNNFHKGSYGPDPDLTNSEFRSIDLYEELAKLNVRYIILHRDIDPKVGEVGTFEPVAEYLKDQRNIKKIDIFGKLDVYKVDIPNTVHLIYSPQLNIDYTKINPTQYKVNVKNASNPFEVYFLENFDPYWEAYIDNQKIENHNRVFSYANKWDVNRVGSFDIILKYQPQDFVDKGMKITKVSVLSLIIICLSYFSWKIFKIYER